MAEVTPGEIPRLPKCPLHGVAIKGNPDQSQLAVPTKEAKPIEIRHVFGDCEGDACAWYTMGHCAVYHMGGAVGHLAAQYEELHPKLMQLLDRPNL